MLKNSDSTATREILWNIPVFPDQVLFYILFIISMIVLCVGVLNRYFLWAAGKPSIGRSGFWSKRFDRLWTQVLNQVGVNRVREVRIFHGLIFWGFLVLLFTTTMVFIDHDLGVKIYHGRFYLVVTVLSDLFGLLLLIGIIRAYHRRYIQEPDGLHNTPADGILLGSIALLVVQGFLLEGLRIFVTNDPWAAYSFVGNAVAATLWSLPTDSAKVLHYVTWWLHSLTVFGFLAILPQTKFFHILSSSANLFFADFSRPKGAMQYPGDIEAILEAAVESGKDTFDIGVSTVHDLTWKQRLDLDSCTSCGRCQDVCPAYNSGKALSPKWLILDTRNHLLKLYTDGTLNEENPEFLSSIDRPILDSLLLRPYTNGGNQEKTGTSYPLRRARNPLVQASAFAIGEDHADKLAGQVMDEDVFWSCTSCRACMEVCPVGIEHVDLIMDVRRSQALVEGKIPSEAQASLRAIETRGNPFGPSDDRANWTDGLDVPILQPGDEVEVLYWVGCVSAYDKRKQSIARSVANILNRSGVRWGILGNRECCTGDPARRLGEENLFQTSAKKNIATLQSISFKRVVANCPHCFNSLKNEYGDVGEIAPGRNFQVVHHSELIQEFLREGRLKLQAGKQEQITFHDPCYLGRYNDTYNEPREVLVQLGKGPLIEMPRSREQGFCCGAGGGHFFMDLKVGERVNVLRINEAAETGAKVVATGCPFCLQMMEDGVKLTDRESSLEVKDIAELVSEALLVTS